MGMTVNLRRLALPAVVAVILLAACRSSAPLPLLSRVEPGTAADSRSTLARGEYIVRNLAACGGCHGENNNPDGPLSGGAEFKDWRLGTIRASNITGDSATGVGAWTDAEIVRAIRTGTARDGHLLAPVMPYGWLHDMSDEDALAVARYLRSLPPVHNEVRDSPNLLFRLARSTFLGPKSSATPPPPPRGATPRYGEYLAQHAGLCADCHTPRGGLQQNPDMDRLFAGNAHPPKDFPVNPANLTPDTATGIGRWSEADFVRTIRTGVNPAGHALNAFMPWHQNARMTDEDLRAIYRYLRTLPPIVNATR